MKEVRKLRDQPDLWCGFTASPDCIPRIYLKYSPKKLVRYNINLKSKFMETLKICYRVPKRAKNQL